jgi:hypothetical protein
VNESVAGLTLENMPFPSDNREISDDSIQLHNLAAIYICNFVLANLELKSGVETNDSAGLLVARQSMVEVVSLTRWDHGPWTTCVVGVWKINDGGDDNSFERRGL